MGVVVTGSAGRALRNLGALVIGIMNQFSLSPTVYRVSTLAALAQALISVSSHRLSQLA